MQNRVVRIVSLPLYRAAVRMQEPYVREVSWIVSRHDLQDSTRVHQAPFARN